MKRLAFALAALLALPANAGWQKVSSGWVRLSDGGGLGSSTPATCTTAGMVPVFLGSPLALGCDAGLTYDAATDTLTVGGAVVTPKWTNPLDANNFISWITTNTAQVSASVLVLKNSELRGGVASQFGWGPTNNPVGGVPDTGLRRISPGLVGVTDGSTGNGALQVAGFKALTGSRPTCDAAARGMTWYVAGGSGAADTIEVCGKAAANTYSWVALATF